MYNKGDRVICFKKLKKKSDKSHTQEKWEYSNKSKIRIVSMLPGTEKYTHPYYRVYNMDFKRYEIIDDRYLKLDMEYYRDIKLKNILNDKV